LHGFGLAYRLGGLVKVMSETPHIDTLRSPLGRARGLGSAKAGSAHWWAQRVTALALVPLTFWFIFSVIQLSSSSREAVVHWLSAPLPLVFMLAFVALTFHHLQLGLQVVIEDYVHYEPVKMTSLVLTRTICWLLGLVCIVSVLKIGI
jgi:succinate dehydrogenase / fumarate reductase, membrane anchor subunit